MQLSIIGIDLGKTSGSLVGLDAAGKVVVRRRMRRDTVVSFCSKYPGSIVAMEACCGAHHIGRDLASQGHEIRLMSPEYVRPYVKAQKNDDRDAEAIAEAASRPTMRFVTLKSEEQLDMQTLHRVRDTRDALARAKASGKVLGGNRGHKIDAAATALSAASRKAVSAERKADVLPIVREIQAAGARTLAGIAAALNDRGITTPRGGSWAPAQVSRVLAIGAQAC